MEVLKFFGGWVYLAALQATWGLLYCQKGLTMLTNGSQGCKDTVLSGTFGPSSLAVATLMQHSHKRVSEVPPRTRKRNIHDNSLPPPKCGLTSPPFWAGSTQHRGERESWTPCGWCWVGWAGPAEPRLWRVGVGTSRYPAGSRVSSIFGKCGFFFGPKIDLQT